MKKLLFTLAISCFLFSCEKEEQISIDPSDTKTLSFEASSSNKLNSSECILNGPTIANIGGYDDYEHNHTAIFYYPSSKWLYGHSGVRRVIRLHPTEEFTCGYIRVSEDNCTKALIVKAPGISDCQCQEELAWFLDDSDLTTPCSTDPCENNSSAYIKELIPACYPAMHPYGRYELSNYTGNNDDVTWSVNYGNILFDYGAAQVLVAANSLYPFTLSANIGGECVKELVIYPCDDSFKGGFSK